MFKFELNSFPFILTIFSILFFTHCTPPPHGHLSLNSDFESPVQGFYAYESKIKRVFKKENVHSGSAALEWTYTIKKKEIFFIAKSQLNSLQWKNFYGFSIWIKSNQSTPLIFQLVERDNSVYQFFEPASKIFPHWQCLNISFDSFEKDPDTRDENNQLDIDQIKEFWIVDATGFYFTDNLGEGTVWIDDIQLETSLPEKESISSAMQVIPSGPRKAINNLKSDPFVMFEEGEFKIWYGGNTSGKKQAIFYGTSKDGKKWNLEAAPVLLPGGKSSWDAGDIETPTLVKVGNIYHMWYCARAISEDGKQWSPESAYKIGHATSNDGKIWVKDPNNPVLRLGIKNKNQWNWAAVAEPTVFFEDGRFKMWYVGANTYHHNKTLFHIGFATSNDGSKWTNYQQNPILSPISLDRGEEYQGYFTPAVFKYHSWYILLFVSDTWKGQPCGPIRWGSSEDGIHWNIHQSPFFNPQKSTGWMSTGLFGPSAMVRSNDILLWFTGFRISTSFSFGIGHTRIPIEQLHRTIQEEHGEKVLKSKKKKNGKINLPLERNSKDKVSEK